MTAFLTSCALTRPSTSVRKSSSRSDQRSPPRATRPKRRCTASSRGEKTKISNLGRGSTIPGTVPGSSLSTSGRGPSTPARDRAVLLVVVGAQGGVDQRQVGPQDPVGVQAGHLVELAADLLGDGLAALGRAALPVRVEPGLEQPDQQPGDGRVGAQHPLHVVLAEAHPALAQVLRVGAQQGHLAPGQARHQHQGVEPVVLGLAVPQRGQRLLEDLLEAAGRGRRRGPQAEFVDPERAGRELPLNVYGCSSTTSTPMCCSCGSTSDRVIGVPDRYTTSVHRLRVLHQPHRELRPRLAQLEHGGQVVNRVRGRDVRLVGLGNPLAPSRAASGWPAPRRARGSPRRRGPRPTT